MADDSEGPGRVVANALASRAPLAMIQVALGADEDGRPALIDHLAGLAASGDDGALDLLLAVIEAEDLAGPAIRRVVSSPQDTQDVAQDVLLAVARSIGGFQGTARFTTWLHRVARNTAISYLRRLRSTDPLGDDEPVSESARLSSVIAGRAEVRAALDQLPPTYRDPVVLRDLQQLSYQEVADRLGLNLNTVKSRIARGRGLLARLIEDGRLAAGDRPEPGA